MCLDTLGHGHDAMSVCSSESDESSTGSAEDADPVTAVSHSHAAPACAPKEPSPLAASPDASGPRWAAAPAAPAEPVSPSMQRVSSGLLFEPVDSFSASASSPGPSTEVPRPVCTAMLSGLHDHRQVFLELCAGADFPLSSAVRASGFHVMPIDPLVHDSHDLLSDSCYEQLLHLACSGNVAFCHGAPPCSQYSRLKLRPGPPALRTPAFLQGVPGLDPSDQLLVDQSREMLSRCISVCLATFRAGWHCTLEQPTNAMSWLEPVTQHFLATISADLVNVAACHHQMDVAKHWLLATSWRPLQQMASMCQHGRGAHPSFAGRKDSSGQYVSRLTARYPSSFCEAYAAAISLPPVQDAQIMPLLHL